MDYSRKNPNRGFEGVHFWEIPQEILVNTPGNSISFLIDPRNFETLFLQYPWKFHVLKPPCLDFFWNNPILAIAFAVSYPLEHIKKSQNS